MLWYLVEMPSKVEYKPSHQNHQRVFVQVDLSVPKSSDTLLYLSRSAQDHEVRGTVHGLLDLAFFFKSDPSYVIERYLRPLCLANE